ncbi:MAG: phospholipase D-like domain-containing protein [Nocardioidaceae bacterium]
MEGPPLKYGAPMSRRRRALLGVLVAPLLVLGFGWPGPSVSGAPGTASVGEQVGLQAAIPAHLPGGGPARRAPVKALPGHAFFNDPLGKRTAQFRLVHHINEAIRRAVPGSTIRLAEYSFAMPSTATALINAHRRGVSVQVVVDGHAARWKSVRRVRAELGIHPHHRSFLKTCHRSCRGSSGNQHAKFITFSDVGHRRDLVMIGSVNFTKFNARKQWNDLYSVQDPRLYRQVTRWFRLMKLDRPQSELRMRGAGEGMRMVISPLPDGPKAVDPIAQRLAHVHCTGARHAGDRRHRTVIRIAMHAWNGSRGLELAHQVIRLDGQGCNIKVLYGVGIGRQVKNLLVRAGVRALNSDDSGRRVHEKVMVLSGVLGKDRSANFVWTGSHNWTNRSLVNDEVILRIEGDRLVRAYLRNFHTMWSLVAPRK